MKKILLCALLLVSTSASAMFHCRAESYSGWGEGRSVSLYTAQSIALDQCARNTPYYQMCYIIRCYDI